MNIQPETPWAAVEGVYEGPEGVDDGLSDIAYSRSPTASKVS
jgi:hypothetical protein